MKIILTYLNAPRVAKLKDLTGAHRSHGGTSHEGRDTNYHYMAELCIKSLIKTGFKAENIICISENDKSNQDMHNKYGVETRLWDKMPIGHHWNPPCYLFYKPDALYNACFDPPSDIVMTTDVDVLFIKDPTKLVKKYLQSMDMWTITYSPIKFRKRKKLSKFHTLKLKALGKAQKMPAAGIYAIGASRWKELTTKWYENHKKFAHPLLTTNRPTFARSVVEMKLKWGCGKLKKIKDKKFRCEITDGAIVDCGYTLDKIARMEHFARKWGIL